MDLIYEYPCEFGNDRIKCSKWPIYIINSYNPILVAEIIGGPWKGYLYEADLLAGDIVDFLNEKYIDKNINEEWGEIDVEKRIEYHEEQIRILKSGKHRWNKHGNGVIEASMV